MPEQLMTPEAFAQSIKAKYPDYAEVPDAELAAKMLEKYPEYRDRVQTSAPKPAEATQPEQGFGERVANAAIDMPVGMVKQAGRLVQMIPGVAAATDKVYGLPEGASKQAMQPANLNQKVGGYLGDVALAVATAGAEAGPAIASRTAGYISNPTIAERGIATLGDAARFSGDVVNLVKANLVSGGPVTPAKVAGLITKYGKDAVKFAIKGSLGLGAYEAYKHLF